MSSVVIRVDFVVDINVPGTSTVSIAGTDDYVLSFHDPDPADDSNLPPRASIEEIRQIALSVGGDRRGATTSPQDGLLFFRSFAAAVETGRISDDSVWIDMLQRVGESRQKELSGQTGLREGRDEKRGVLRAAARNDEKLPPFIRSWTPFTEIPDIVDVDTTVYLPPAQKYMADNVRLLGFFGESPVAWPVLVRLDIQYFGPSGLAASCPRRTRLSKWN